MVKMVNFTSRKFFKRPELSLYERSSLLSTWFRGTLQGEPLVLIHIIRLPSRKSLIHLYCHSGSRGEMFSPIVIRPSTLSFQWGENWGSEMLSDLFKDTQPVRTAWEPRAGLPSSLMLTEAPVGMNPQQVGDKDCWGPKSESWCQSPLPGTILLQHPVEWDLPYDFA